MAAWVAASLLGGSVSASRARADDGEREIRPLLKTHCFACHGADAEGLPDAGSALTLAVNFVPSDVEAIDSIIVYGIPERITRSAIAMPARGGKSDLSTDECLAAAAYVWVISQVQGEPWPGGHRTHVDLVPAAALTGTAADLPPGADDAPR